MTAATRVPVRLEVHHLVDFVGREIREIIPPTLFFFIGFGIILLTKRLILAQYLIEVTGFTLAAGGALIVGKAVLIANALPFLRRFDTAPLIRPILFKTIVYTIVVLFARLVEEFIEYLIRGGAVGGFARHMIEDFLWQRFVAEQIWIAVLFLIYTTGTELNTLFGDGELSKILFTRRSSELKLTRRQRVRELVQLGRFLDAHPVEELRVPNTAVHAELETHLRRLAR
jgi:hypothetical protein